MKFSVSSYFDQLSGVIDDLDLSSFDDAISLIMQSWMDGKKIFAFGNGGSALTASHHIHEWNKMAYLSTGKPFRGHCLSDSIGLITAYSNDMSYADVYSEQLKNMLDPGDLVIALSGSGNSENVVRAIEFANEAGAITLAVCGFDGGRLKKISGHSVWVPCDDMQICEDLHFIFGHMVMKALVMQAPRDGLAEA
ncbi:MAG: SIS domain-containing protein [Myxococcales bacterium]